MGHREKAQGTRRGRKEGDKYVLINLLLGVATSNGIISDEVLHTHMTNTSNELSSST